MTSVPNSEGTSVRNSEDPLQSSIQQPIERCKKLNLGCGHDHREGYLNVDMHAFVNPDLVADALDLSMLPSAAYDEIVAQDVLEHFHWRDTPRALFEWNRLLKKGGSLFIRTTYVVGLARRFEYAEFQDIAIQKMLVLGLFSNQWITGDYHLTSFSERLLRYYLWETGYEIDDVTLIDEWLVEVRASKINEYYDETLLSPKLDDTEFVCAVYRLILHREADAEDLSSWIDRLSQAQIDRRSIIRSLLLCSERETKMETTCPRFELKFDRPGGERRLDDRITEAAGFARLEVSVGGAGPTSPARLPERPYMSRFSGGRSRYSLWWTIVGLRGWLRAKFQRKPESALSKIRWMTRGEALAVVDSYYWFHSIDLGGGITTPGQKTPQLMAIEFENTFAKIDLTNKSVLDIGAWNGGFSVEAMRRGAAQVVALDHYTWNHSELRGRETFELACRAIGTNIEAVDINLDRQRLDLSHLGRFDIVLFLGVFYHLMDPINTLREIVPLVRELLIVETYIERTMDPQPLMIFYPGAELAGDVTNWWRPNTALMIELLRAAGFARIEVSAGAAPDRQVFHAYRNNI